MILSLWPCACDPHLHYLWPYLRIGFFISLICFCAVRFLSVTRCLASFPVEACAAVPLPEPVGPTVAGGSQESEAVQRSSTEPGPGVHPREDVAGLC